MFSIRLCFKSESIYICMCLYIHISLYIFAICHFDRFSLSTMLKHFRLQNAMDVKRIFNMREIEKNINIFFYVVLFFYLGFVAFALVVVIASFNPLTTHAQRCQLDAGTRCVYSAMYIHTYVCWERSDVDGGGTRYHLGVAETSVPQLS